MNVTTPLRVTLGATSITMRRVRRRVLRSRPDTRRARGARAAVTRRSAHGRRAPRTMSFG